MILKINNSFDVLTARNIVSEFARNLGYNKKSVSELLIVISELGENLVNHNAINGRLIIFEFENNQKKGIEVVSEDEGPGIANVEAVLEDGYSTAETLGIGLGSVKRLMNEFKITSKTKNDKSFTILENNRIGTKIIARKYLPSDQKTKLSGVRFNVFTRSKIGEKANGDNFFIKHSEDFSIVSVIDGLGHGQQASIASLLAKQGLMEIYEKPLEEIIEILHTKLKGTRGAAISIAKIYETENILEYVGIGNVLTKVFNSPVPIRPVNYNGTIGLALRKFKKFQFPWNPGNIIIMNSDGISSQYEEKDFQNLLSKLPIQIAQKIFTMYNKTYDDATILVGK